MVDLVVRSRRAVTPDGERPAAVVVTEGRIVAVEAYDAVLAAAADVDLGDTALLPGLVDTHVHVNEPGRTEWEGFATATRAAAAGGVTAIVDMPLNSLPPTVDVDALRIKRAAARGSATSTSVSGAARSRATPATCPACTTPGCSASRRSWPTPGCPSSRRSIPTSCADALAAVDALFVVHAEDPWHLHDAASSAGYADFLASRPPDAEHAAVATAIDAAREARRAGAHPAPLLGDGVCR